MRNRLSGYLLSICVGLPAVAMAGGGGDPPAGGDLPAIAGQQARMDAPTSAVPDDETIKRAVREILAEEKESASRQSGQSGQDGRPSASTLRATTEQKMTRAFDEAQLPLCLHSDGLRNQPTSIGPIGVAGLFALPFVAVAAARGVCSM
jgi:hypothetical protein